MAALAWERRAWLSAIRWLRIELDDRIERSSAADDGRPVNRGTFTHIENREAVTACIDSRRHVSTETSFLTRVSDDAFLFLLQKRQAAKQLEQRVPIIAAPTKYYNSGVYHVVAYSSSLMNIRSIENSDKHRWSEIHAPTSWFHIVRHFLSLFIIHARCSTHPPRIDLIVYSRAHDYEDYEVIGENRSTSSR